MEKPIRISEKEVQVFDQWVKSLSENGKVLNIDAVLVRGVLESFGANFEISENARKSLGRYSNKGKREGLNEVWGKERVDMFKSWAIGEYIPVVEKRAGRELHTLWDKKTETFDDVKHSGMMHFFGELTGFAAGEITFEKYKRLTEDRLRKGIKWEFGDRYEPYKPSPHASFPVDFPVKAIDRLKTVT